MKYRSLGHTGLKVSVLGLGTNSFGGRAEPKASTAVLERAVERGVNLIDTANIYTGGRSEAVIGDALASSLKSVRDRLVVATKVGLRVGDGPNESGSSRFHIQHEVEKSLVRLKTDVIDLLWIHTFDPATPLEETLMTLDGLVRQGKVRYVGCSNYRAWETMKALGVSRAHHLVPYQALQLSYSLADRWIESEAVPLALDQGLGIVAYFPLAGGVLAGRYLGGKIPEDSRAARSSFREKVLMPAYQEIGAAVADVAREVGATSSQVSLAWLLQRPGVTSAIAGATRPEQVEENLGAVDLELPEEALARLDQASETFLGARRFGDFRL